MSEWTTLTLSEVCDIYDGPHATPKKLTNGLVFLGISSISYDGRIDTSNLEYISETDFKRWTKRIAPKENDIIFSYETKLGTVALIPKNFVCCLGRRMGLLRCKENVSPKFLLYYYLSPEFQKVIHERTYSGSTVDRIPLKEMPSFPIRLPSYIEQQAIAEVLSALDDKIDLLQRQNQTLEQMAATLFRQWFIEEAKEDWEDGYVEDLFVLQRGFDLPTQKRLSGEFELYAASGLNDYIAEYNVGYPTVITGRSGTIGKVFISFGYSWPLNTTLFINEFKAATLIFSYFFLKNMDLELFNSGSAVPSLNRNHIHGLEVKIPPRQLINNFEEKASALFNKKKNNLNQIHTLQSLRDTLLPKLISGEVRLKGFAEKVDGLQDVS